MIVVLLLRASMNIPHNRPTIPPVTGPFIMATDMTKGITRLGFTFPIAR
jgi:hypothetical protein